MAVPVEWSPPRPDIPPDMNSHIPAVGMIHSAGPLSDMRPELQQWRSQGQPGRGKCVDLVQFPRTASIHETLRSSKSY